MSLPNRGISRSPTFHRWSGSERLSKQSEGMGIDRMPTTRRHRTREFLFASENVHGTRRLRKEKSDEIFSVFVHFPVHCGRSGNCISPVFAVGAGPVFETGY